ncbi:MAG: FIST C-terminal domain-containing protein [Magnetospirillum sp.]|nr:FIST C-terminal domain-containing protein [Magnetospirillum sp.]
MPLRVSPLHGPLTEDFVTQAVAGLAGTPGGVVALLPEAEQSRLPVLQACCRRLGVPLVGGVFPSLIVDGQERRQGVWLLRFDIMPPVRLESGGDDGWLGGLPDWVGATGWVEPTLFSVFDACLPNLYFLLRRMGDILDDQVAYAGANAGSETFQPMACLFDAERVVGQSVLLMLLPPGDGVAVEHGYGMPKRILRITGAEGNRIAALDDQPALQVYAAALAEDYGIALSPDNFYQHAVHYPFAVLADDSLIQVRIPVAVDEAGGMHCVGEVPQGGLVVIIEAPDVGESDCIPRLAGLLGQGAAPLLTFYCAGRRLHLGEDKAAREMADLARRSGTTTLLGALSLGEVSTDGQGRPAFHNAALVCLRLQDS